MDFSKFDERGRAEEGTWTDLLDPNTLEPIVDDDGETAQVLVRGTSARSVQKELRKLAKLKPDDEKTMEAAHNRFIASATPLIAGFKNVNLNDEPVDPKKPEAFLDLTFPRMGMVEDEDGVEKLKMVNKPFALQIIDASVKRDEDLGNG